MTDLIRRLAARVRLLLFPPGREPLPYLELRWVQPPLIPLPPHRSPYGLDTPLDVTAVRAVRPYVEAA
ncbi:hypothetical protein [Streptomyces incarnatus]|uniref:hypothetical protein n=1 Tax=Streptomyces incarnatus TaxID=665007 RepID=UPI000AEDA6B2|nr:hypothetical protein [Streptomyces incarnatus]